MPCAKPIEAWQHISGGELHFQHPAAGGPFKQLQVPCGYCILCRQEQARQWAVRITHEAQRHEQSSFITLTYDDEHLPEHNSLSTGSRNKDNWQRPEDRYHLQKFFKLLRYHLDKPIRYYAVGEYGDKSLRPHYHACIFGHAFVEGRVIIRETPTLLWTSPLLEKIWGRGMVSVGALTFETAQYTASYVTKKLRQKQKYVRVDETTGELINLVQPRAYVSLRPAIGAEWLKDHGPATYNWDRVVINGRAQKPPKYYDRWLEKTDKIKYSNIKQDRMDNAERKTPEQNRARAQNAHARVKRKSQSV